MRDAGQTGCPSLPKSTEDELKTRWGQLSGPIAQVPLYVLQTWHGSLESLAESVLLHTASCADAGYWAYLGYLYDPSTGLHTRVVAAVDGDTGVKNLAPEAENVVNGLADLVGIERSCAFWGAQCVPDPESSFCSASPTTCFAGDAPSVAGDCWDECVTASRCLELEDCSPCGDHNLCVVEHGLTFLRSKRSWWWCMQVSVRWRRSRQGIRWR